MKYPNIQFEDFFDDDAVDAVREYQAAVSAMNSRREEARATAANAINAALAAAKTGKHADADRAVEHVRKALAKSRDLLHSADLVEIGVLYLAEVAQTASRRCWMSEWRRRSAATAERVDELNALANQQGYPEKSMSRQSLVVQDDRRRALEATANAARSRGNENFVDDDIRERNEELVAGFIRQFSLG